MDMARRHIVTDMGSATELRSDSGETLSIPRYGAWSSSGRKPQVVDTSDDLGALLRKYDLTEADVVKMRGASDDGDVAGRVAAGFMPRVAGESLIDLVIDKRTFYKLESQVDEQTWELAREVYVALMMALELDRSQHEALSRLRNSVTGSYSEAMHRNNMFKAAHALGIKLPSASF